VGNPCLRIYFKNQWNAIGGYVPWTDCAQNGADLLRRFNPLPYEKDKVKSGDTSTWDLSLIVKALLQSRPPFVSAANLVAALETLRGMRNNLSHASCPKITTADFEKSWNGASNALTLFGAKTEEFKKVKKGECMTVSQNITFLKGLSHVTTQYNHGICPIRSKKNIICLRIFV
jgi:hypothetical protein